MRHRPAAGILLALVVTATAGATTANRIGPLDGGATPAAAVNPGTGEGRVAPDALPPPPGKTLLVSRNGGESFHPVATHTRAELHALAFVRDPSDGRWAGLVAGARGAVLRFDPAEPDGLSRCPPPWL